MSNDRRCASPQGVNPHGVEDPRWGRIACAENERKRASPPSADSHFTSAVQYEIALSHLLFKTLIASEPMVIET